MYTVIELARENGTVRVITAGKTGQRCALCGRQGTVLVRVPAGPRLYAWSCWRPWHTAGYASPVRWLRHRWFTWINFRPHWWQR